jgi:phosphohistidine swiveling domain-containing protein
MEYPLDLHVEKVTWGPIPAKIFYSDWWKPLFLAFPKAFPGYVWPKTLCLTKEGKRFVALMEAPEIHAHGGKLFLGEMLPRGAREKHRADWKRACDQLRAVEQDIASTDMTTLASDEFVKAWNAFNAAVSTFWVESVLPELSNFGSSEILATHVSAHVPEPERASVMETLTAPEGLSFYQEEDLDLLATDDLAAHQQKYFWLNNSYDHVEIAPVSFFEQRKKELKPELPEEIQARLAAVATRKREVSEQYSLPQECMDIAGAIADGIVWQDTRKKEIWTYLHYEELFLAEAVRRLGVEKPLLLTLCQDELTALFAGTQPMPPMEDRTRAFGLLAEPGKITHYDADETLRLWTLYVEPPVAAGVTDIRGIIASKGKGPVRGPVCIILDPRQAEQFQQGDVLVTSMTTPEYVFLMKKAAAVVTDTGGLTSHAAIVSRELHVPCIVGTKVATQVLKDGDMVEVDAERGIVQILK